jgi:hypothetical protein
MNDWQRQSFPLTMRGSARTAKTESAAPRRTVLQDGASHQLCAGWRQRQWGPRSPCCNSSSRATSCKRRAVVPAQPPKGTGPAGSGRCSGDRGPLMLPAPHPVDVVMVQPLQVAAAKQLDAPPVLEVQANPSSPPRDRHTCRARGQGHPCRLAAQAGPPSAVSRSPRRMGCPSRSQTPSATSAGCHPHPGPPAVRGSSPADGCRCRGSPRLDGAGPADPAPRWRS